MSSTRFPTLNEWHGPLVESRPTTLGQKLSSTTAKVGGFAVVLFGAGTLLIGVGAFVYFSGGNPFYALGGVGGGALIIGFDVVVVALASWVKWRRQRAKERNWAENNQYFEYLPDCVFHGAKVKDVKIKKGRHFSRQVLKVKRDTTTLAFVKAGGGQIIENGRVTKHSQVHPLNDAIAYWLDELFSFGVIPKTMAFQNTRAALEIFSEGINEFELEEGKDEWMVIVQQAVPKPTKSPSSLLSRMKAWIRNTQLDSDQAHKAILFNVIAGRLDNHLVKIANSAVSKDLVYEIDNDQLGYSIEDLAHTQFGFYAYHWLFAHEVANQAFSDEVKKLVLYIDPQAVKDLFKAIEFHYKIKLDEEFKVNIVNNLETLQEVLQDKKVQTPADLFKKLHPSKTLSNGQSWPEAKAYRLESAQ